MNVLSLFDGISCGRIALEKAGIKIDKYYSSEIEKSAIDITQKNYPDTVQIGDITKIKYKDGKLYTENGIYETKIDLLIGGSPCQGFSNAGKMLNFKDERSILFFEYVRLLNEIKPKYFLLENVKMKKEWQDIITRYLRVEPVEINSKALSAQNRPRLYWTNFDIKPIKNKNIKFIDILENKEYENKNNIYKEYTNFYIIPRAKDNKLINGSYNRIWKIEKYCGALSVCNIPKIGWIKDNIIYSRKITVTEAEKLQTLPVGYTSGVSDLKRHKLIGNAWTVDVLKEIFKNLLESKGE